MSDPDVVPSVLPPSRPRLLFPESWPPIVLATVLIAVATLLAYHHTFSAPFIFDDLPGIARNPNIRQLSPLGEVLLPNQPTGSSVVGSPMVNLSLALNYAVGGLDPRGYHAINLIIHVVAGVLLFAILRLTFSGGRVGPRLAAASVPVALAAALLWTLHPLQTESVTYVIQRAELLVGMFYLLTLYAFLRATDLSHLHRESPPGSRGSGERQRADEPRLAGARRYSSVLNRNGYESSPRLWAMIACVACGLGMMTNPVMVTAPVIVFLYDRTFVAGTVREAWRRHRGLHLALIFTWLPLLLLAIHGTGRAGNAGLGAGVGPVDLLLTQYRAVALYLKLAAWPDPLVLDYGTTVVRRVGDVVPQALLILLLGAATAIALIRRPVLGFAGAWFFTTLAPSSSVLLLATQTIAEHRVYLPLAAITTLIAVSAFTLGARRGLIGAFGLALFFGGMTWRRNSDYESALTLWTDTVAKAPDNVRARFHYANALSATGRAADAIAHYEAVIAREPRHPAAHYHLAGALLQLGRADQAIAHYETALRLEPDSVDTHVNLAAALVRAGRMPEAVVHYEEAAKLGLLAGEEQLRFGRALAEVGRLDHALVRLNEAARLNPKDAGTHVVLGMVLSAAGKSTEALHHFTEAVLLDPDDGGARAALGDALIEGNRPAEALSHYEAALRLQPAQAALLHASIGNALLRLGRAADAIRHYEEALRLNPDDAEVRRNLAAVRATVQRRGLLKN